ncbi:MAG: biotin--[acetyl-CoA-carboxylase] ligase [Alphaproteobacteria bacterium]|nr:biotin--[acetyl-CoA-carboxylase] ligase [Alphaproteobacteria bacterium]
MALVWAIETYDSVHSTQDIVKGLAELGQSEGKVVQALEQTGGRGRHGRQWISEKGNLYLSVLLRPTCQARHIGQLSILIAVALADTIRAHLKDPDVLMLKWPNDVLIGDQKCAGILIETALSDGGSIEYAAVGVGVNLASAPPQIGAALNGYAKKPLKTDKFRDEFLKNLNKTYALWSQEGFEDIKERWLQMAHKKGTNLRIRIGVQVETGLFYGIDDDGNLLLHDRDLRQKKVTAGEVYLIN